MTPQNNTKKPRRSFRKRLQPSSISKQDYEYLVTNSTLPPDVKIEFSNSRKIIAWGMLLVIILFAGGFAWMYKAKITGTVIAPGTVKLASERQIVQHLEGGIVKDILVKNGDKVKKGQTILIMESSGVNAGVKMLRSQQYSLLLTGTRLKAEKDHKDHITWPPDLVESSGKCITPDIALLQDSEQEIFLSHRKALADSVALLENQIKQINEVISSLREQIHFKELVIKSLREELAAKSALYKERFIDKSVVLNLQRNLSQAESFKSQLSGKIAENMAGIEELKIRIKGLRIDYTRQAAANLGEVNTRIIDVRERLRPRVDAQKRLEVKAPVAGEIMALRVHSTGEILGAGAPILEIVPDNASLIIECRVPIENIAEIHLGLFADVQLAAFNSRTNPKIRGEVTYISADKEEERTAYGVQSFYIIHIALDKEALAATDLYISPGMPVAAFINTEPRTVLSSVLDPLRHGLDRALREE